MSWWRKAEVKACHIVISLICVIDFSNIKFTSPIPARLVGFVRFFFSSQTSSEEIAHSFLINGAENTHQNKICDLVHKLFDSSEKKGMQLRRTPGLVSVYCQRKFFCATQKIYCNYR